MSATRAVPGASAGRAARTAAVIRAKATFFMKALPQIGIADEAGYFLCTKYLMERRAKKSRKTVTPMSTTEKALISGGSLRLIWL